MRAPALTGAALVVTVLGVPHFPQQRPAFRSTTDLVSFGVSVTDRKGKLVTTLGEHDFEIYEDGRKQTIQFFVPGGMRVVEDVDPPVEMHLGVLLDISGSMENDIAMARSAAIKFLNTLPAADDITLVDFDTEVRIARFEPNNFPRLVERIRSRKPEGNTALYDALGVYLDNASAERGRKILVLYTDGVDNQSQITFSDLTKLLRASDVTVYSIGFLEHLRSSDRAIVQMNLQEIAEITGGQFFVPTSIKDLESSYEKVKAEITAQYGIGYVSTNQRADGTWRKVEIKIVGPARGGLKPRARQGYFAPYRDEGRDRAPDSRAPSGVHRP